MAQLIHLNCRHCGEPLTNKEEPYCPPCNLYLCYRAMPIILGMFMHKDAFSGTRKNRSDHPAAEVLHDDEPCIMVAYTSKTKEPQVTSAYEEEPCIIVAY